MLTITGDCVRKKCCIFDISRRSASIRPLLSIAPFLGQHLTSMTWPRWTQRWPHLEDHPHPPSHHCQYDSVLAPMLVRCGQREYPAAFFVFRRWSGRTGLQQPVRLMTQPDHGLRAARGMRNPDRPNTLDGQMRSVLPVAVVPVVQYMRMRNHNLNRDTSTKKSHNKSRVCDVGGR